MAVISRDLLVPYQMRAIRLALLTTSLVIALLVLYIVLPGRPPVDLAPFAITLALAFIGMVLVMLLPWGRLFDAGVAQWSLYAWSFADILLVTVCIPFTGGLDSDLWFIYALIIIFFAASYPIRGQVALLGATIACYMGVLLLAGEPLPAATMLLRLGGLGLLAFFASFLSVELGLQMNRHAEARSEADRRARRFAVIASAARSMQSPRPHLVLHALSEAAVELGFASSVAAERMGGSRRVRASSGDQERVPELMSHVDRTDERGEGVSGAVLVRPIEMNGEARYLLAVAQDPEHPPGTEEQEALDLLCSIAARALESSEYAGRVRASEERFRALVRHSSDLMLVLDRDEVIVEVSDAVERTLGVRPGDLIGSGLDSIIADDGSVLREAIRDIRLYGGASPAVVIRLGKPGSPSRLVELIATNLLQHPDVRGIVLNGRDVTERQLLAEELEWRRYRSPLAGLLNRAGLLRAAQRWREQRSSPAPLSIVFVDLVSFSHINDLHGRAAGDALLRVVGDRFAGALPLGLELAHMSADQYAVLAPAHDATEACALAHQLLETLGPPFPVGDELVSIRAVAGVASDDGGDLSPEQLAERAEVAAYAAKRSAEEGVRAFDAELESERLDQLRLELDLRRALDRGELDLVYQPVVDLLTGQISALEALVRWRHPERGTIPPGSFIPIAEASGLIEPLGDQVARDACRQLAEWRTQGGWLASLRVNINVSPLQLLRGRFAAMLAHCIEESGVPAEALTLEITEESFASDAPELRAEIEALERLGVRLAVDDFGVGYSSLGYLQRFPIDAVKIDRSFTDTIGRPGGAELLDAIIELAQRMQFSTVAEGVERHEQVEYLRAAGCNLVQGYYLSEPLPAAQVPGLPAVIESALSQGG